jgi:1,2-phenylacetyl-CoA epoxidase PaaB subunit
MTIKKQLKEFYDAEAENYYYTRNKHRSDGYIILDEIKKYNKKTNKKYISILEF